MPGGVGLRGIEKVQKRYLIAAVARNLGLVMRKVFGMGTPRGLQAEGGLVSSVLFCVASHLSALLRRWYHVPTFAPSLFALCYATAL